MSLENVIRKSAILLFLGLALSLIGQPSPIFSSSVHANPYLDDEHSTFLNGDSDYVRLYTKMGNEWYLEIPSVDALLYNPPEYELCATVLHINRRAGEDDYSIVENTDFVIRYDWDSRTAEYSKDGGEYHPVYFTGSEDKTALNSQLARKVFFIAYGMEFYFR